MRRMAVVLILGVVVLAGLLTYRLRTQEALARGPAGGSGDVEGVEVDLSSKLTARILSLPAPEGSTVRQGDVLVTLDCADAEAQLAEAEARLAASQAQAAAAAASVEASKRQREAVAASSLAARAQAEALQAQRDAAQRQASRLEALSSDVALSSRDQTKASAQNLEHQTQAALAQAQATAEQARAAVASIRASGAQAVAAEAQIKAAEAAVRRARILVGECRIIAPRDGVVDQLPHEVGELVLPGQTMVKLVDLREVKAIFYLPNAEVAAARPGMKARVLADAYPNETFEGVVRTVSVSAEFTPRNIQTRSDRDRLVYPVEVAIANPERKLRAGMPVQVTLLGAER